MRTHISIGVKDLDEAVRFYQALLNAAPTKHLTDYALFLTDAPPLELALDLDRSPKLGSAHFGISVEDEDQIRQARTRLQAAGFGAVEERWVCCYARQEKIWTSDPDGRPWEVYHVLEETAQREERSMACCGAPE